MCGIFGYFSTKSNVKIEKVLTQGLYDLEFRGYDSAGIAVLQEDLDVYAAKTTGKVSRLDAKLEVANNKNLLPIGIAHTRWATNGDPSETNCHPHQSDNFWVVHNGIINNEEEIKQFLKKNGFSFYSETDTELIPKLISYHQSLGSDLITSVINTLQSIEGTYAVLICWNR
jgi:glutamine---fructose-6-phosphate transaminase (isomerizing)